MTKQRSLIKVSDQEYIACERIGIALNELLIGSNTKNQNFMKKWLPNHSGRAVHNAQITYSSWGEVDVEYKYKKNKKDANLWGYDPNKVFPASIHFTSKAKAKQFIKELKMSNE